MTDAVLRDQWNHTSMISAAVVNVPVAVAKMFGDRRIEYIQPRDVNPFSQPAKSPGLSMAKFEAILSKLPEGKK